MRNLLFLAPLAAALTTERAQHGPLISLAVEAGQGCHPRNGPARGWCEVGFCDPSLAPTCASGLAPVERSDTQYKAGVGTDPDRCADCPECAPPMPPWLTRDPPPPPPAPATPCGVTECSPSPPPALLADLADIMGFAG